MSKVKREAYRRVSILISDSILESESYRETIGSKIPDAIASEMGKIAAAMAEAGGIEDPSELNDSEIYSAKVIKRSPTPNKCCGSTELKFNPEAGGITCGRCHQMLTGFDHNA